MPTSKPADSSAHHSVGSHTQRATAYTNSPTTESGAAPPSAFAPHVDVTNYEVVASSAARIITREIGVDSIDVAMVLGSGWAGASDHLGTTLASWDAAELPGFAAPLVAGHRSLVICIRLAATGKTALIVPRTHLYEGRGVHAVAHPIRVAAATGASTLVLTNGCGSLNPDHGPGTVAMVRDHINLTGATPLHGAAFVDMSHAYSPRLRDLVHRIRPDLPEGVYVQFPGPQYETPAEVRMARILGGDFVGMSTTLETLAARALDVEVLGLSLVTNLAAGMASELSHTEVLAAGSDAAPQLQQLLVDLAAEL